ncbi:MAG TPA: paraquat-inducible protein A [Candidatus Sulfopaludibacter sp.]|nr:paraquat-inducible protein A [Candidatus Sulfopaludibacter sp.]
MGSRSNGQAMPDWRFSDKFQPAGQGVGGKMGRQALIGTHFRSGLVIVLMLVLAMAFFVTGIFLPFTSVTKLWLFQNQISVYHGLIILWQAGELFLFLILFVFTVIFPFVKISAMLVLWLFPRVGAEHARQMFHFVSNMGKWSMLDVFVVAILVLTIKSGGLASIRVEDGFFLFFVSVMLTQFASLWTGKVVSHLAA